MTRLPSHGLRFGLPPKLHGHEIVQLQLSATVAVTCQFGAAARGGAVMAVNSRTAAISTVRMPRASPVRGVLSMPDRRNREDTKANEDHEEIIETNNASCSSFFFVNFVVPSSWSRYYGFGRVGNVVV